MKKFFIVGCAKTGTTLVRRLFNSFENINICNVKEISLDNFIKSEYNVGKRTSNSIFSNVMSDENINNEILKIKNNNITIVYVERNKKDTLLSSNGYVPKERYEACVEQANKYSNIISCIINYDLLVEDPDREQERVSKILNLNIKYKWSEYPDFINEEEEANIDNPLYKLRPISSKNKGNNNEG